MALYVSRHGLRMVLMPLRGAAMQTSSQPRSRSDAPLDRVLVTRCKMGSWQNVGTH